jgi:tetratricopeptide (TPR) repeat protein
MESGDRYLAEGQLPEAIIEYRNAVEQDPRAGDVRAKLADTYARAGDGVNAIQEYVRAADLSPDDSAIAMKAGGLLLLAGRYDDAKLWAEKVLAKDPAHVQAQILLASALAGLKDLDAAVAEIEEAIRLDPTRGATYTNLGAFELRRGQEEAAERAFSKAIELDPRSTIGHLAIANFYWSAGRLKEAEASLAKATELDPENPLAHRTLATFYVATNRAAEAEPHLKRVADITQAPAATLALADHYLARKNFDSARALLDRLAASPETAAVADVRLAVLDRQLGNADAAYGRLERVLAGNGADLQALLTKSAFLLSDRRGDEALAVAAVAAEKHPEAAAAFFNLGRAQAARFQTSAAIASYQSALRLNPRAGQTKVEIAKLQLASGGTGGGEASVGLAQEALAEEPENLDARLVLVRGLIARGDLRQADAELKILAARVPNAAAVQVQMGRLLGLRKDTAGARRHFERALELDSGSNEALGGLVAVDLAGGRLAEARARVDNALASRPNDAATIMLGARVSATMGDFDVAEQRLRRVIEIEPGYLPAYGSLAQLFVRQKRMDEALAEFEQLAKREPRPVAALTLAGMILDGQGKTAEARERYERALQLDPEAPVAANNLAWLHAHSGGSIDLALQLARTAYGKLQTVPEVVHTLGVIYFKKNLHPEAIRTLKAAVELDPSNALYHYHLGLACDKAGDRAGASEHLRRALALNPNFDGAVEAKALLTSLMGASAS